MEEIIIYDSVKYKKCLLFNIIKENFNFLIIQMIITSKQFKFDISIISI
jgi:hypothetical protein